MNKNFSALADRLATLKKELSVAAFAAKCKVPQPMMDRYIKGENAPSAEKIILICVACGCSADWLLGLSDVQGNTKSFIADTNPQYASGMKKQIRQFRQKAELAVAQATELLKTVEEIEEGL